MWKARPYLTENRPSRNEMWCAADDDNFMCHICAKGFKIRALIKQLLISNFQEITQIPHIHKNHMFKSIIGTF